MHPVLRRLPLKFARGAAHLRPAPLRLDPIVVKLSPNPDDNCTKGDYVLVFLVHGLACASALVALARRYEGKEWDADMSKKFVFRERPVEKEKDKGMVVVGRVVDEGEGLAKALLEFLEPVLTRYPPEVQQAFKALILRDIDFIHPRMDAEFYGKHSLPVEVSSGLVRRAEIENPAKNEKIQCASDDPEDNANPEKPPRPPLPSPASKSFQARLSRLFAYMGRSKFCEIYNEVIPSLPPEIDWTLASAQKFIAEM
ncbi:hypothetical protein FN846DRAFT_909825 [Sphaerosporella brunnea]|uniref:Uncharacterized protein n=1 Tax=Sphaerosporella brunnea TaxID=1250544 RepID=A0A5J5EQ41_9PEZI|nr:hypothetical protein FN846DRAFT_909825 [Sphaerosporella brunnea]